MVGLKKLQVNSLSKMLNWRGYVAGHGGGKPDKCILLERGRAWKRKASSVKSVWGSGD